MPISTGDRILQIKMHRVGIIYKTNKTAHIEMEMIL